MTIASITKAFDSLKDPRKFQTPPHSLLNIISICGVIGGADNFVTIAQFGQSKQKWFESFLDMPNGIPSHDTFNDVLNRLNPTDFAECFTQWISRLAGAKEDTIALDGKVMRGTFDKINGGKATWLVNAWSVANNLCFGLQKVEIKSNENTAIPKLQAILDIEGATVTTDAKAIREALMTIFPCLELCHKRGISRESTHTIWLFPEVPICSDCILVPAFRSPPNCAD